MIKKPIFYGWWIVIAGAITMGYTSGTFWQGFGAFYDPIVQHFGWSGAVTSAAVSLQRTESGMISPFVGYFIDKFGPRKTMTIGIIFTGFGFIFLSLINSLWQFYAAFTLITLGMSLGTWMVSITAVTNWFVSMRTRAIALLAAGSAMGGLLLPLVIWLIAATNWRIGLMLIGVGFWAIGLPAAIVMRSRPEDLGLLPDGENPVPLINTISKTTTRPDSRVSVIEPDFTVRQALATRTFWQMSIAMGAGQLVMSANLHQIPALTSFGFTRGTAGLVLLSVSLMSLVGRLGSGFAGDTLDKRKVIAASFALQVIGTVIFVYSTTMLDLIGFIIFWGIGFGASIPVRFTLLADYFGRKSFGSVMGIMMTVSTIFGVIGPVFVGWMFDLRANYRDPYLILSSAILIAIPLVLGLPKPTQYRR